MLHKSMYLCNSETFSFQIPTPFLSICFAYIFAAMSIYTMRQPPGYKCVKFCNVYRGISWFVHEDRWLEFDLLRGDI